MGLLGTRDGVASIVAPTARRAVALGVLGTLVATGCGEGAGDRDPGAEAGGAGGRDRAAEEAQPPPGPAPTEASVERIPTEVALQGDLQVVGDTVLAQSMSPDESGADELVRSTDGGRTWEQVPLPSAPDQFELDPTSLQVSEGVAVLTTTEHDDERPPAAHVWTSADGIDWRGGPLPLTAPPGIGYVVAEVLDDRRLVAGVVTDDADGSGETGRLELFHSDDGGASWTSASVEADPPPGGAWFEDIWADGDRLLAVVLADSSEQGLSVLQSDDQGQSWRATTCPGLNADGDECIASSMLVAGSLHLGPGGASTDGGQNWSPLDVEPSPAGATATLADFKTVVELPSGGWLATVSGQPDGPSQVGALLRSADGVRWEQVYDSHPCDEDGFEHREVLGPARLGGGWLVVDSCLEVTGDAANSTSTASVELHVLDGQATEFHPLDGFRDDGASDHLYEQPVAVRSAVLVPRTTSGATMEILRVTP